MTNDQIENFLLQKTVQKTKVQINFKTRSAIVGVFLQTADFVELKQKNLWRIVSENHLEEFNKSKDTNLARIFNGVEFTKLVSLS